MKKLLLVMLVLGGCASHVRVEPLTVQPIHVIVDINMHDDVKPRPAIVP
ncbi:MAG TPA: hypothetical protein VGM90_01400 [Kofleriaceae bacterium]|jgi:hypothetical protein